MNTTVRYSLVFVRHYDNGSEERVSERLSGPNALSVLDALRVLLRRISGRQESARSQVQAKRAA